MSSQGGKSLQRLAVEVVHGNRREIKILDASQVDGRDRITLGIDAFAEVSPDFVVNGGALKGTFPGGKYAVLAFRGTVEQVGEAWAALLRDWLPSSGLQLDARPSFEYYPKGSAFDPETGVFECEICVPVISL